jgi:hypothetical protein
MNETTPEHTVNSSWLEFKDLKRRRYNTQVWMPLRAAQYRIKDGERGNVGYREEFLLAGSVAVNVAAADRVRDADANSMIQQIESRPHVDNEGCYVTAETAEFFFEDVSGIKIVLQQRIPGSDKTEWSLNQDFILALNLLRVGDAWVRVEEGRVDVARLHRDADDEPVLLEVKAEFLKDYLATRKMGLILGTFVSREVIVEDEPALPWKSTSVSDEALEQGWRWRGDIQAMHEGGQQYGTTWTVFHMRRTDFDPDDEVPNLEVGGEVESKKWTTAPDDARKVYRVSGEIWRTEWISPGPNSPRVAEDEVPSTSYFVIDAAGKKVSGDALNGGLVWLWFRPEVVNDALSHPDGGLGWYTADTGNLLFAPDQGVGFGVNEFGFVNVLAVDIGRLPHWSQAKWAGHNVAPTGKISQELRATQVDATPADTLAPEAEIPKAFKLLADAIRKRYGIELFRSEEHEAHLLRIIHRFRSLDRESLLSLAKDLTRVFADRVDAKALQKAAGIEPPPPAKPLGSLKALERALATLIAKERARQLCGPLFGIYDLRIGSAHLPGSEIEDSLRLANVDVKQPFVHQGHAMLIAFVVTLRRLAVVFDQAHALGLES